MPTWPDNFVPPVGSGITGYLYAAEVVYETPSGSATGYIVFPHSSNPAGVWFGSEEASKNAENKFKNVLVGTTLTLETEEGVVTVPRVRVYSYTLVSTTVGFNVV